MVSHVVLMTPRPDLSAGDRRAFVDTLRQAFENIPAIRGVRLGRRVRFGASYEALATDSGEYVAVIDFDDLAGLRSYLEHPAHEALGRQFYVTLSSALVYDYEVGGIERLAEWT